MAVSCLWAPACASAEPPPPIAQGLPFQAVVKVYAVASTPNYHEPWQNHPNVQLTGSGCVVAGRRILTNAHNVANQTFLMVKRQGDPRKYVARILSVGHECDLALITVDDDAFFDGVTPFSFGPLPNLQDSVVVLGYPMGGDNVSITEGVVSRIEPTRYSQSWRTLLSIQIDAAINPGNSGGPVLQNGKIAGIAFQGMQNADNIGYIIPTPVVEHFLSDVSDGRFDGFPIIGPMMGPMENPDIRASLGMPPDATGALVIFVPPYLESLSALKAGDVITAIDGIPVANDGTIPFRKNERIIMDHVAWSKFIGDTVELAILRSGKPMVVKEPLVQEKLVVPSPQYDRRPSYHIFGGLVFVPLTTNYLLAWNNLEKAPGPLTKYLFDNYDLKHEDAQIVVMTKVLADDLNIGYQDLAYRQVSRVDGEPVRNLAQLVSLIEAKADGFVRIELADRTPIVLDRAKAIKANPGILERYRVQADRSDDMR